MSLRIYWGSGSPVSWRVLLALAIKKVDYQSERLNLGEKQHRSPEYLALNPRGSFPLLVDADLRVRGSMAILNTLERMHPQPPLFGSSPAETGAIWVAIDDHGDHLGPATQTLTRAFFRKNGDRAESIIGPARDIVERELGLIEEGLEAEWIAGDRISAADLVLYPTLHRLLRVTVTSGQDFMSGLLDIELSRFPRIAAWEKRLTEQPGVASTYPPHWRD